MLQTKSNVVSGWLGAHDVWAYILCVYADPKWLLTTDHCVPLLSSLLYRNIGDNGGLELKGRGLDGLGSASEAAGKW